MNSIVEYVIWAAVIFTPIECLFAFYPIVLSSRERKQNAFLMLFNAYLTAAVITVASFLLFVAFSGLVPTAFREKVAAQPFLLQILLAALVIDFGIYVSHRLSHSRLLWRFHEIHHSAEEMNWMVAFRFHPIDLALYALTSTIPAALVGFSVEALAVAKAIHGWQAFVGHANIRLRIGPLGRIFVGPQFHHWHHANRRDAYDRNFGGLFVIWDWLFGTLYAAGKERPDVFGTTGTRDRSLIDLLIDPFRKRRNATSHAGQEEAAIPAPATEEAATV